MAEKFGVSIVKSTSPEKRSQILRRAHKLKGKKVFIETFLFNYRGRLLSVNEDHSLSVIILASDEVFREIRIDLPLIIEIGELLCEKVNPPNGTGGFSDEDSWSGKRNSVFVLSRTSHQQQRRINRIAPYFKGEVVIVKTLIYHYVVCIVDADESFLTVRQLVDFIPHFVIEFRISTNIIYDIVDYPK